MSHNIGVKHHRCTLEFLLLNIYYFTVLLKYTNGVKHQRTLNNIKKSSFQLNPYNDKDITFSKILKTFQHSKTSSISLESG